MSVCTSCVTQSNLFLLLFRSRQGKTAFKAKSPSSSSSGIILDLGGSLSGKEVESRLGWAKGGNTKLCRPH